MTELGQVEILELKNYKVNLKERFNNLYDLISERDDD